MPFLADDELSPIQHLKRFVSETPAQRMRREADEFDAKDRAIARLRAAVAAYEGSKA